MKAKALEILDELKAKNEELNNSFNAYVKAVSERLEVPEEIAVNLVRTELVNKYERKLILSDLFSKLTLEELGLR